VDSPETGLDEHIFMPFGAGIDGPFNNFPCRTGTRPEKGNKADYRKSSSLGIRTTCTGVSLIEVLLQIACFSPKFSFFDFCSIATVHESKFPTHRQFI
jgi:hypothetical protein